MTTKRMVYLAINLNDNFDESLFNKAFVGKCYEKINQNKGDRGLHHYSQIM